MIRLCLALLLAPLVASCQPPDMKVHAAFIGNELVLVAADPDDADYDGCWYELAIVNDAAQPVWEMPSTSHCGRLFPRRVGNPLAGPNPLQRGLGLETGRLYIVTGHSTGSVSGAFALSRAGRRLIVHNVDPDSPAAHAVRDRYWESRRVSTARATEPAAPAAP